MICGTPPSNVADVGSEAHAFALADVALVLSESVTESVHGQWLTRMSTLSDQGYTYDKVGRLAKVSDSVGGVCTSRWYTFDGGGAGDSNRTKLETFDPTDDGSCQTATASSTVNSTFDAADRITTSGTVYDALGRTTTVPDGDALDAGALTVGYHVNDLVRSVGIAGGATQTYTLDVDAQRVRSWTDGTTTRTNHYDGESDNPAWTAEGGTAWTRTIGSLAGDLAAIYDSTAGAATLQLTNLHGDVVATAPTSSTTLASTSEATEYGTPRGATGTRYGWLGGKQRAADTPAGLSIMGLRLYNPALGRFLQADPIYGGNANSYVYPVDPINGYDLDGRSCIAICTKISGGGGGFGPGLAVALSRIFSSAATASRFSMFEIAGNRWVMLIGGAVFVVSFAQLDRYYDNVREARAHKKNKRQSTKEKHERGDSRRAKDKGTERADSNRRGNPNRTGNPKPPKPRKDNGFD